MKSTIVIICQDANKQTEICTKLSDKLGMFYSNIADLLEYNFINQSMKKLNGKEYFESKQKDFILSLSNFQNAMIDIDFKLLQKYGIWENLKHNFLFIYLKDENHLFDKKCENVLKSNVDFTVCYRFYDMKQILDKIIYSLKLYYSSVM